MHKPILAALDDSARAEGVFSAACALASTYKTALVLCRVMALPVVQVAPDGLPVAVNLQGELEKHARAALAEFLPRVPPEITTSLDSHSR